MKKKLLVSFSGGETSAFMAQWLWKHKQDEFEMIFVFANTGEENEETLEFVEKCSNYFGFPIVWVEAKVLHGKRKGSSYEIVDFNRASRHGEPFREVIKKYGIPNQSFPHCTRELKANPIQKYAKDYFGTNEFYTAIGIRIDEADRIKRPNKQIKPLYPLINKSYFPCSKQKINFYWSLMPFRLNLKGYQGNCKVCWKKSDPKLFQIAKESPEKFKVFESLENDFENYTPESRTESNPPYRFFRGNRTVKQIFAQSNNYNKKVKDDSIDTQYQFDLIGGESCEVFSGCGND